MKTFLNFIRTLLFVVVTFYVLYGIFWGANWFWFQVTRFLGFLENSVNTFVFWLLLITIIGSGIVGLWRIFKAGTFLIQRVIMRITPYRIFGFWCTVALGLLQSIPFLYGYWFYGGYPKTVNGYLFGVIYTYVILSLLFFIIYSSLKINIALEKRAYNEILGDIEEAKLQLAIAQTQLEISDLKRKIKELEDEFERP